VVEIMVATERLLHQKRKKKNPQIQISNTSSKTNFAAGGFSQGPTVCT
jgi:hypothetical protein